MRAVAGMATIRSRESSFKMAVESLHEQVDSLKVYFNDYEEIPEWVRGFSRLEGVLYKDACGDIGDSGKFHFMPPLSNTQTHYFTVDDDIIYPKDYVQNTLAWEEKLGVRALFTYHGRVFYDTGLPIKGYFNGQLQKQKLFHFHADVHSPHGVHFGGTGVMCFNLRHITVPFDIFNKEKNAADIFVGVFCQYNRIPIVVLPHAKNWLIPSPLEYVNNSIYGRTVRLDTPVQIINREMLVGHQHILQLFEPEKVGSK